MDQPAPPRRATIRIRPSRFSASLQQELISEIVNAARAIADARGLNGALVFRSDGVSPEITISTRRRPE